MRFRPASYLKFWLSVPVVLSVAHGVGRSVPVTQKVESISVPGTKAFPESITSTSDGALFVGRLGEGGIVRITILKLSVPFRIYAVPLRKEDIE
jgi:hypothetical protein